MPREVFVLKSGRCSHGSCIFCGYGRILGEPGSFDHLKGCFDRFFSSLPPQTDEVCVYGSGSFLDGRQVPADARAYFIKACVEGGIRKLTVESRPEYVTRENLADFKGLEYTIAIGLEVGDDRILRKLNKGFSLREFEEAAETVRAMGGRVRAYLLVNPPYVKNAKRSLTDSVAYALKHADSVVLINTLPHTNSPLFDLWISGEWNFLTKTEFKTITEPWAGNPAVDLDAETFKFTPKFPERLKKPLAGVGEEYLTHPHFEVWQDWLTRWYTPPEGRRTLLFLPCSYTKPYSESETHRKITGVLEKTGKRRLIHEVMLSNAGVIPREFEDEYPFNAYDWNEQLETPEVKERYVTVTSERIAKYLRAHQGRYDKVLCYLKYDSESYQALKKASQELGTDAKNLLTEETYNKIRGEKKPLTREEALSDLARRLTDEVR